MELTKRHLSFPIPTYCHKSLTMFHKLQLTNPTNKQTNLSIIREMETHLSTCTVNNSVLKCVNFMAVLKIISLIYPYIKYLIPKQTNLTKLNAQVLPRVFTGSVTLPLSHNCCISFKESNQVTFSQGAKLYVFYI